MHNRLCDVERSRNISHRGERSQVLTVRDFSTLLEMTEEQWAAPRIVTPTPMSDATKTLPEITSELQRSSARL